MVVVDAGNKCPICSMWNASTKKGSEWRFFVTALPYSRPAKKTIYKIKLDLFFSKK